MLTQELTNAKIKDLKKPVPVNQESPFGFEELFFSVTDPKSNITFANETFLKVSKYRQKEILGQLHKIIRHPDMPRAVFHVFWTYLKSGKPVAAYVKNLAKDGSYYWVLAVAYLCKGGYLSVRLKPGTELFKKIKPWYSQVLDFQNQQEKELKDKKKAMIASEQFLLSLLQKEGFSSYDDFMWHALRVEMSNRELFLRENVPNNKNAYSAYSSGAAALVPASYLRIESILGELVLSLKKLEKIQESLSGHSNYILKLARSILLLSLNAQIGSSKLDQEDLSLSVVAEKMGEQSVEGEKSLIAMKDNIQHLHSLIKNLNFDILSAKLLIEMFIHFCKEPNPDPHSKQQLILSNNQAKEILQNTYMPSLIKICDSIGGLTTKLRDLAGGVKSIERFLLVLRFIHITGKVEVARMNEDANSFSTTFQDLVNEIENAESHLQELNEVVNDNKKTGEMYSVYKERLTNLIANIDR
jgi:aerotaxis receptor